MRLLHWSLVSSVAGAWITRHRLDDVHAYWGYAALCIVGLRLVWGFVGGRYARFTQFVRPWQPTWRYLRGVIAGHAPRYIGHNPLGGWSVLVLLALLLLQATSGLFNSDDILFSSHMFRASNSGAATTTTATTMPTAASITRSLAAATHHFVQRRQITALQFARRR